MDLLTDRVLVLNKNYQPINVTTVKKALKKVINEKAEIITVEEGRYCNYDFTSWSELSIIKKELEELGEFDDLVIDSEIFKFIVPRVVRILSYDKYPTRKVRLNRKNIYTRDQNTCQYCGKVFKASQLNIDHVFPKSRGGKNTWTNLVCSCQKCNEKKADKTPKEANMKLVRKSIEPKYSAAFKTDITHKKYMTWKHFISEIYWNIDLEI